MIQENDVSQPWKTDRENTLLEITLSTSSSGNHGNHLRIIRKTTKRDANGENVDDTIIYDTPFLKKLFNRRFHKLVVKINRYNTVLLLDCKEIQGRNEINDAVYESSERASIEILPMGNAYKYNPLIDMQEIDFSCEFSGVWGVFFGASFKNECFFC